MTHHIDILDKSGRLRYSVPVTEKCVYSKTLMGEEYILLSFISEVLIYFKKGDYIETQWGRFILFNIERPSIDTSGGYQYEVKFHREWEKLRSRILFYSRQNGAEKSWKLTQRPEYFLDLILDNISEAGLSDYSFAVDASLDTMKYIEFDATNILDALTKIAEAWETEWWIQDKTIHLSKCEYGTPLLLETGDYIATMDSDKTQSGSPYTRLYAFGSTRNLSKNYRREDTTDVIEGVVETRLKLPVGIPYIDAWEDMEDEDVVEGVEVFEDIYPKQNGVISSISTHVYTDEIIEEEATRYEDWLAYRFTDDGFVFSEEYKLQDQELRVVFQTGKLAGMDFAVNFNPDGVPEKIDGVANPSAQIFEIIRSEDYGVKLPSTDFHPEVEDTYILYGYNASKIGSLGMIEAAEHELLEKAREKLAKTLEDDSVYTCTTNPIRCAGYRYDETGVLVYCADEVDINVGQSVLLKDSRFFTAAGRISRIRSFEKRLDNIYAASYEVGISGVYRRSDETREQVQELTYISKSLSSSIAKNNIPIIKRHDATVPSDFNVYSALRARHEALSRIDDDVAQGSITFLRNAKFGEYTAGSGGGFMGMTQHGSLSEVDYLKVRKKAQFETLEIAEVKYVGGKLVVSPGEGTEITAVEDDSDGYICYYKVEENDADGRTKTIENMFVVGDQIYCKVAKISPNHDFTNRYWWRLCTDIGKGWFKVSKTDRDNGSDIPIAGDRCAQLGNRTDSTRQSAIVLSTIEISQTPLLALYGGISSYSLEGKDSVTMGGDEFGVPFLNVYGRTYIGDRNGDSYVKYSAESGLEIRAKITAESTIGGESVENYITNIINAGFSDSVLSPYEKKQLLSLLIEIRQEHADFMLKSDGSDRFALYDDAYWTLLFILTGETKEPQYLLAENGEKLVLSDGDYILLNFSGLLTDTETSSEIDREGLYSLFEQYYTRRNAIQLETAVYDHTKTVIDGGIVTSGTIQLAGDDNNIKAGITGEGLSDDDIRIWAGDTFVNRANAPFRVTQAGNMVATDATIKGLVVAEGLVLGGSSMITAMAGEDKGYILPCLDEGFMRSIEVWVTSPGSVYFEVPTDDDDEVFIGENIPNSSCYKKYLLREPGLYRLVGICVSDGEDRATYWNIIKQDRSYDSTPTYPNIGGSGAGTAPGGTMPWIDYISGESTNNP